MLVELELGHNELSDTFGVRTHGCKSSICIQIAIPKDPDTIRACQLSMSIIDDHCVALLCLHHGAAAVGRLEFARTVGADSRQFSAAEPAADTLLVTDHG